MKGYQVIISAITVLLCLTSITALASAYGQRICDEARYQCYDVKNGDTWRALFPDERNREIVQRINRTNLALSRHDVIAVPKQRDDLRYLEHAPFALERNTNGQRMVIVDLSDQAFAAYGRDGKLLHWGPIAAGKRCNYNPQNCRTPLGSYTINTQMPRSHESSVYPLETNGGAPMPYAMHYLRGFALHGSPTVPGRHASHGCVRLFVEDAKWLNHQFTDIGTRIIVRV